MIELRHLFKPLDEMLIELLRSLNEEEWHLPTIAKLWRVKDVAAHLLDGNMRILSMSAHKYFGDPPEQVNGYDDLVRYLNQLNADWVKAMKRVSPELITSLLETTGTAVCRHYDSLDPSATALFPVAWAGENVSNNRMHLAREYTEKWLHQQQIREATGRQALFTRTLFYPFIHTFMHGLPHTFRHTEADNGTCIEVQITGEAGGKWFLVKEPEGWLLKDEPVTTVDTRVTIDPGTAWKLFSKGISPDVARAKVQIEGENELGEKVLQMVSVMA